jgi:Cys-tRNA(Pro)/Cys-tRNA(Cys) deacylase
MAKGTPATLMLEKAGVAFAVATYEYDPDADRIGMQAAEAMGVSPGIVLKTLMAEVDGKAVCVVVPSDTEVSMKKLAACFGGKTAAMVKVPDAERLTGYKVGGIGPFGQKRIVPTALDETAELYDVIYINAGQRGLLLSIAPADAVRAGAMKVVDLGTS